MKKKMLLSVGMNAKLGKKIGVFNLPQGVTCPGATETCRKLCYALKAERMYKSARDKRALNLEASKEPGFTAEIIKEIKDARLTKVRIHESGDFYAQEYLDKWVEIIRACPEVTFLAYTKSFLLRDFTAAKTLTNFSLLWSTDSTSPVVPADGVHAFLVQKGEPVPQGYFTCQANDTDKHYCGTRCTLCWNSRRAMRKVHIYFDQH